MNARIFIGIVFVVAVVAIVAITLRGSPAPATSATGEATKPAGVQISMLYGTEKKDWVESAAADFAKEHPDISLKLEGMGSFDAMQAILDGKEKPTIFSPADTGVLTMLAADWDTQYHTPLVATTGDDVPEPLVITPLVFAIWQDRADALQKKSGGAVDWNVIHDAVVSNQGWPAVGGKPDWGFVKLGHTDPTRSNSGLQALLLMTMEFHKKPAGLQVADVLDPKYQKWVGEVEKGVTKFETSTGTFMTDMIRFGPSKFDIAVVYESNAIGQLGNAQGRWGDLHVYYPTETLWSDHPAALLQGDWVTPEQKAAARTWLAFLHGRPMQERALAYGFRPGDTAVPLLTQDPNNPFVKYAGYGVKVDIPPAATPPDATVLRNLMQMWTRTVGTR